jgi:hypothetical protein
MEVKEIQKIIKEKVSSRWQPEHDSSGHKYRFYDYPTILNSDGSFGELIPSGLIQKSVTTKLGIVNKPHLLRWAIKQGIEFLEVEDRWSRLKTNSREELIAGAQMAHADTRDSAGNIGTIAHNIIEQYINEWIDSGKKPEQMKVFAFSKNYQIPPASVASARAVEAMFTKHNVIPIASELLVGHPKYSAGTLDFLCFWDGKLTLVDWKTSNSVDSINYAAQTAAYKYMFEYMAGIKISQVKVLHLSKDYDKFEVYKVKHIAVAWRFFKAIAYCFDCMDRKLFGLEKDIKRLKI